MIKNRGRMKYVPPNIMDEIRNIKLEENIKTDVEAFRKMADFSCIGRQAKNKWILGLKKR